MKGNVLLLPDHHGQEKLQRNAATTINNKKSASFLMHCDDLFKDMT